MANQYECTCPKMHSAGKPGLCPIHDASYIDKQKARAELSAIKGAPAAQTEQQTIYLYRRKGQDAFATCDEERFGELSAHPLFEVKVAYAARTKTAPPASGAVPVARELLEKVESLLACPQHHTRPEYIATAEELRALLAKAKS